MRPPGLTCRCRESFAFAVGAWHSSSAAAGGAELGAAGEGELLVVRVEKQCGRHALAPLHQLREGVSSEVMYRLTTHFYLPSTSNGEQRTCGGRADRVHLW